jgi:hypothetical protein
MHFSPNTPNSRRLIAGLALAFVVARAGAESLSTAQTPNTHDPVGEAQKQVIAYLADLADVRCKESVLQEKLAENGHVQASEHSDYDYFIMMQGDGDDFQLTETREAVSNGKQKPLPMLVTNGFSTLLLVFHPYYRDAFQFEVGTEETIDGRQVLPVHFTHIPGKRTPAALALRGRDYALDLKGTAWIDEQSGHVVKMEASLLNDMSDLGLRSMTVNVEYRLTSRGSNFTSLYLPASAVIDVQTTRQHWRNTHLFTHYGTFSTSAEQGAAVTYHPANPPTDSNGSAAELPNSSKEKH